MDSLAKGLGAPYAILIPRVHCVPPLYYLPPYVFFCQFHVFFAPDKKRHPLVNIFRFYLKDRFFRCAGIATCLLYHKSQWVGLAHEAQFAMGLLGIFGICWIHKYAALQEIPVKVRDQRADVSGSVGRLGLRGLEIVDQAPDAITPVVVIAFIYAEYLATLWDSNAFVGKQEFSYARK